MQALNPKDARVLIVEDSPNDQEIVKRALKTFGIRHFDLARTAEDGLDEASKRSYDVVLADYNLPGMNGLQFLEYVRKMTPDTRVILVTGARQESIAVSAMKLGATDYISKDEFLTSGIVRSLQAALRTRITEAEIEQREATSAGERELQRASVEATWLLQAMDERHGYQPAGSGPRDPLAMEWSPVVTLFADYIRAGYEEFPLPATEQEDALLRVFMERGVSPREVIRLYIAALRGLLAEGGPSGSTPVKTVLFLSHIFACLAEEFQTMLCLQEVETRGR
jgi:DNA-binding NarL/FixJ family response regulator